MCNWENKYEWKSCHVETEGQLLIDSLNIEVHSSVCRIIYNKQSSIYVGICTWRITYKCIYNRKSICMRKSHVDFLGLQAGKNSSPQLHEPKWIAYKILNRMIWGNIVSGKAIRFSRINIRYFFTDSEVFLLFNEVEICTF